MPYSAATVVESLILLLALMHQIHAQQGNDSQKESNISIMEWSIPVVALVLAFIIITGVIAYTLYRQKKYGAFCCLMPKMRYRVEETIEREDYPSPPPSYDMSHRNIIAPPEYHDALQDVLLESGESNDTEQTDSRFTSWSNITSGTPPAYSSAVTDTILNTASDREMPLQQNTTASRDNINRNTRDTDSLSNATMSPTDIQITGAEVISPPVSSASDADTEASEQGSRTLA